jgi:hypothetical protein
LYWNSPEVVAIHYGFDGKPDRWGNPMELFIVFAGMIVLCTAISLVMPVFFRRAPASKMNIPNKEYWTAPERRGVANAKFAVWADLFGTVFNALMIPLLLMPADTAATLGVAILIVGLNAFGICSLIWLSRAFRVPARTG